MDVFISEEYVTRRRLEKKKRAATSKRSSESYSQNYDKTEDMENKATSSSFHQPLSNIKCYSIVGDNDILTYFCA